MHSVKLHYIILWLWIPVAALSQSPVGTSRPVIVQGAMPSETDRLVGRLQDVRLEQIGGWKFWHGSVNGYPVIVSRTMKGIANAAAATAIAIERYRPAAIINQGTAGGVEPSLHLRDIVIGLSSISIGAFKSPYRPSGGGSNALDWVPMNLIASEGSAASDTNRRTVARFRGDSLLIVVARKSAPAYTHGRVVEGVIASSDMWNDEVDRLTWFHKEFGASVEEMETAAAAQVARFFSTPFLGIRIVSDNTTNGESYQPRTGEECQDFVFQVVKAYVATRTR
jgi:adenosylhomocysteine nucleosidase